MSTSIFRNKNLVRPKKTGAKKRQRLKAQRQRLLDLGMPEEVVAKLNSKDVRTLLKRPKEVEQAVKSLAE